MKYTIQLTSYKVYRYVEDFMLSETTHSINMEGAWTAACFGLNGFSLSLDGFDDGDT